MAEVFLCQAGQLTPGSRRELKRAGVVVVEVENPGACQFIRATEAVSADDMLWAAVHALKIRDNLYDQGNMQRSQFAANIIGLIESAHARRNGGAS